MFRRKVVRRALCVAVGLSAAWVLASCARRPAPQESREVAYAVALAFSADGSELTGVVEKEYREFRKNGDERRISRGAELRLWDLRTGKVMRILARYSAWPQFSAFSGDGRTVAIDNGQEAQVFDAVTGASKRVFKGDFFFADHGTRIMEPTAIAVSPDGDTLAMATQTFDPQATQENERRSGELIMVRLCDVTSGSVKWKLMKAKSAAVEGLSFSGDGKTVATSGDALRVWSVSAGKLERTIVMEARSVVLSADRTTLAGVTGTNLRLWDVKTGKMLLKVSGCPSPSVFAFSPDSKLLVGQYLYEGGLCLWDTQTGARHELQGHEGGKNLTAAVFSTDGNVLASASEDETIRLWNVATGKAKRVINVTATPQHTSKEKQNTETK